jgi:formylglycine-generating enzyme required for sulfatase activity
MTADTLSALKVVTDNTVNLQQKIDLLGQALLVARADATRWRQQIGIVLAGIVVVMAIITWNLWMQLQQKRIILSAQAAATTQALEAQAAATAEALEEAEKWAPFVTILGVDPVSTAIAARQTVYDVWRNPVDDAIYVYVPKGTFNMGSTRGEGDEQPIHPVTLDAYWIMRTEVTNAHYIRCVTSGSCSRPNPGRWQDETYADHPITNVNWAQANAYCMWSDARLPTEAEWEKAARGADGRIYPWGNDSPSYVLALANYKNYVGSTNAVGNYPAGASPYGVLDMAGNVWEWVNDWYADDYYAQSLEYNPTGPSSGERRVLRGGSWSSHASYIRADSRHSSNPGQQINNIGFRCVRSE